MKKPKSKLASGTKGPLPASGHPPQGGGTLIAHARNDITIPYFTGVFNYTDDTLVSRGGGQGLKIYDDIERDAYAHAVLQKRKLSLVGREWRIEPASESRVDRKAAELVEQLLLKLPFDQLCLDLLDATLKGFAIAEIVWAAQGNMIVPQKIVAHDPRRFVFDET